jgi:flagellar biosynthesis chaperone FliJ
MSNFKLTFNQYLENKGVEVEKLGELSAEEQVKHYSGYQDEANSTLADAIEKGATKEEIQEMKSEILTTMNSSVQKALEIAKEQGEAIKGLQEKLINAKGEGKSIDNLKAELKANESFLKKLKAGERMNGGTSFKWNHNLVNKAVGSMTEAGNITGEYPVGYMIPGYNNIPTRRVRFLETMTQRQVGQTNLIKWVYKDSPEGDAGQTDEGATKSQRDFNWVVGSEEIVKTTAYTKVSDEMLEDITVMESAIRDDLMTQLLLKVEENAYSGNGTAPNHNGVFTTATAWSAISSMASAIDNANIVDVLVNGVTQIIIANHNGPTAIWMNPQDIALLQSQKVSSTDKRYVERLTMVAGSLMLDGIPIIPTTLVTQDTFLIGEMPLAELWTRQGITIDIGYDLDDFTKNFKTIRAEWRGATVVKNNNRTAFVNGDFTTAKAALETT